MIRLGVIKTEIRTPPRRLRHDQRQYALCPPPQSAFHSSPGFQQAPPPIISLVSLPDAKPR